VIGDDHGRNKYLIHDCDRIFAAHLDDSIRALGVEVLRSPIASPKANSNTRLEQRSRALDLSARSPTETRNWNICGGQFELLDSTSLVHASMVAEQESQQDEAAAGSYVKRLVEQ
jgi:hypothetical protein